MTLLAWLVESAVRLILLVGVAGLAMYLLRVTSAETQLRAWTVVILAAIALPFVPAQWVIPIELPDLRIATAAGTSSVGATIFSRPDRPLTLSWPHAFLALYAVVGVGLLGRLLIGWRWARRLGASARVVEGQPFLESPQVGVPVTVGVLSPRVIVPDDWRSWPADTRDAVVAHERAHAARRDGLWLTLALVHRAIHWINPFSWWLARHIATLTERASDDAALERGIAPTRYAEVLLSFATVVAARQRRVAWILPMARPAGRDTERRLDRVLTWKGRASMNRSRLIVLVVVLAVGSVALYTATVSSMSELPPNVQPGTVVAAVEAPVPQGRAAATPVITEPIPLRRVHPKYTAGGMRAKIQGTVELEIKISAAGVVIDARVQKSLDAEHGLDAQAMEAVMQWTFEPKTVDGVPTAATTTVQMEFRLH
jgi:TonB family protein